MTAACACTSLEHRLTRDETCESRVNERHHVDGGSDRVYLGSCLLEGLKTQAENKSNETAASKYFTRGPYLRQFIEELDSVDEDAQALQGDIGLTKFVAATMACNRDILSRVGSTNRYSTCMKQMESALANNSDLVSIVSHEIDIGYGKFVQRHMVMAMLNGVEITIDPAAQHPNTTGDATSRVIGRGICSKVQPHLLFALGEWRWAWLAEFEISRSAPLDRYRVLVQVQRDMFCIRIYFVRWVGHKSARFVNAMRNLRVGERHPEQQPTTAKVLTTKEKADLKSLHEVLQCHPSWAVIDP